MAATIESSKTQKLYLMLRHQIVTGEREAGERLPSEPELCSQLGVSRVTVRRALDQLQREALIVRRSGAGTFVASNTGRHPVMEDLKNALAHLEQMGRTTDVKLLSFSYVEPGSAIANALRLPENSRTQRSVRVRLMDGEPFSYLVTHVPEWIGQTYSEADLASTPLLSLLERSNVVVERATQTISATLASPDLAEALSVSVGAALLSLTRTVFNDRGDGIEHLQAYYRPDLYTLQLDLVRSGRAEGRHWTSPDDYLTRKQPARRKVKS